jgi:hypothetical protein
MAGSFEEMSVTVKFFITIVHQSDFDQGMRLDFKQQQTIIVYSNCFWNTPLQQLFIQKNSVNFQSTEL